MTMIIYNDDDDNHNDENFQSACIVFPINCALKSLPG